MDDWCLQQTRPEWQLVFYIIGAIYGLSAIIYLLGTSGEIQPWVKPYMDTPAAQDLELQEPLTSKPNSKDSKALLDSNGV